MHTHIQCQCEKMEEWQQWELKGNFPKTPFDSTTSIFIVKFKFYSGHGIEIYSHYHWKSLYIPMAIQSTHFHLTRVLQELANIQCNQAKENIWNKTQNKIINIQQRNLWSLCTMHQLINHKCSKVKIMTPYNG